jgi:hypothetical protein
MKILISVLCSFLPGAIVLCNAQNVTSPYSILGIGDIDTKDYGRYFSSGNASIARRDANAYNLSNPASLTALPFKIMHLDISMRGRLSNYRYPDADTALGIPSNDFVVKRIAMAFRVDEKTGIAFGFRPYSSVNYRYLEDNAILDGNTSYFKLVEGDGGINQFHLSFARKMGKHFSAGITASWLFGSLKQNTQYISPSIALNITKKEIDFYYGASAQGGLQYFSSPGKKWTHLVGLTTTIHSKLKGELTTEYFEGENTVQKNLETGREFKLPLSIGFGYSAVKNEKLSLSMDVLWNNWRYQKVNYSSSYTYPSLRVSAGIEYSFKQRTFQYTGEKSFIAAGISAENSYLRIKNKTLTDISLSIGAGRNFYRSLAVYGGVEVGRRGNANDGQIQENYTQFIIGLTFKDLWLGPKYTRRYD